MIENGLYVIKKEFLEIIARLGGNCDIDHNSDRSFKARAGTVFFGLPG